jgi:negative regulator of replication initiation
MNENGKDRYPTIPPQALELLIKYNEAAEEAATARAMLSEAEQKANQSLTALLEKFPHLRWLLPNIATHPNKVADPPPNLVMGNIHEKRDTEVDFLDSPQFRAVRSVKEGFLLILAHACTRDAKGFESVPDIDFGGTRKCISKDENSLKSSGRSVRTQRIPGTDYWADTNNDTERKIDIQSKILRHIGYGSDAVRAASAALRKLAQRRDTGVVTELE